MQKYIPQLEVQTGGIPKNRNLIIGDPAKAKILLSAHYDTCARIPVPNFITPKRPLIAIGYSVLIAVPVILIMIALNLLLARFTVDPLLHYWLSLALYAAFMILILSGPANKHTANDNTSGVITLIEIYNRLSEEQRQQVCFLFFDNEEQGLLGSGYFRRKHKKMIKDKLLINFDCVSDGEHFLLGISKKANQKYHVPIARSFTSAQGKNVMLENLKKVYYPSDQAGFPLAIAVASLKHSKLFGYYMDRIHTKRDTVFDESNIDYLVEHTAQFIESI